MNRRGLRLICIAVVILLTFAMAATAGGSTEEPKKQATGSTAKRPPVVGISTGSSGTSWRNIMIDALKTVGDEYKAAGKIASYKIVNNVTNGDATEQANILRDFISEGVDIILVNPNSPSALNGVIKEAQDEGILVVSYDATVTAPDVLNVEVNQYNWMKKNVEFVASTLKKGNVIEVYGLADHPGNIARMKATADVLKNYPDIKVVGSTSGYWDQTKAKEAATQLIGSGQRIDGIITQDSMAYGCLSAFLDANKLPKVMIGDPGTAFFKVWKRLREQGADFKCCAQANPPGIGGTGFRLALSLYNGKKFKPGVLTNGTYYVKIGLFFTDENFEQGWALLKDKPDDYLLSEIMSEEAVAQLFE